MKKCSFASTHAYHYIFPSEYFRPFKFEATLDSIELNIQDISKINVVISTEE